MGFAERIPRAAAAALLDAIDSQYLRFFPTAAQPLPAGKDAHRDAACHCALGNIYQALTAAGLDVDGRAPWIREWFVRYQLLDGGWNCDDKPYSKGGPSSIQSTVPVLEALLGINGTMTAAEEACVDRGVGYLLARRLAFRRSDGRPMRPDFMKIAFPRFYDYDFLRGLCLVAEWAARRNRMLPRESVSWSVEEIERRFPDGLIRVERPGLPADRTWARSADGGWGRSDAAEFPLLVRARAIGRADAELSRRWSRAKEVLRAAAG
jgi:hypothetical protein